MFGGSPAVPKGLQGGPLTWPVGGLDFSAHRLLNPEVIHPYNAAELVKQDRAFFICLCIQSRSFKLFFQSSLIPCIFHLIVYENTTISESDCRNTHFMLKVYPILQVVAYQYSTSIKSPSELQTIRALIVVIC